MENYSFFLFCKLFDHFHTTDTPYDELYGEVVAMYEDYQNSEYDDGNKPEYECMVNYLSNHFPLTKTK